jgi:hypothetical protein
MLDTKIILSGVWVALMLTYLLGDVLASSAAMSPGWEARSTFRRPCGWASPC